MKVLEGILSDSRQYYRDAKKKIEKRLASLPQGSVKERKIAGKTYYYLQYRAGEKVRHKYLGKSKPVDLLRQLRERKILRAELKKIDGALRMLKRAEGRKRG